MHCYPGGLEPFQYPVDCGGVILLREFHTVKPAGAPSREKEPHYQVRVIDRVVAILDELAHGSTELGDVELAKKLGLHKSTVHRLLVVLQRDGFVEREPGCTKYGLGWRSAPLPLSDGMYLSTAHRKARPFWPSSRPTSLPTSSRITCLPGMAPTPS